MSEPGLLLDGLSLCRDAAAGPVGYRVVRSRWPPRPLGIGRAQEGQPLGTGPGFPRTAPKARDRPAGGEVGGCMNAESPWMP